MTNSERSDTVGALERARREARRLLKDLRGDMPERAAAARQRFARLHSLAELPAEDLGAWRERVRLKHALAVIAEERDFASWRDCKREIGAPPPAFHAPALGGFLFRWFADHAEARASRREHGGYLLPFGSQCFVCEADAVSELGLDPADPDWDAVCFDLFDAADAGARDRLFHKRRVAIAAGIAVPAARRVRR